MKKLLLLSVLIAGCCQPKPAMKILEKQVESVKTPNGHVDHYYFVGQSGRHEVLKTTFNNYEVGQEFLPHGKPRTVPKVVW